MSAKKVVMLYGNSIVKAIKSEFKQLVHDKEVFVPKFFHLLSWKERRRGLCAIALIDLKQSGRLKGWTVANGSVQRKYIPEDDAASPTVCREAVFLTSAVDGWERQVVAIVDISGAFFQALIDVFEDKMVDIMISIKPLYSDYIYITSTGKKLLSV